MYDGPLRDEPIAVELHNTLYASDGQIIDGLADEASSRAWLTGVDDRLPRHGTGSPPTAAQLRDLRTAVRRVLDATINTTTPPHDAIETLNRHSARAPGSLRLQWPESEAPTAHRQYATATRADIALSALAADAITLVTGPDRVNIRACGAPGCVLMFVKQHRRREWCSSACGNRARQARHYLRTRGHPPTI